MRAVVVALGDLGRSARMLYHAHALAAQGVDVDLVGFEGTSLPKMITDEPRVRVHRLNPATLRLRGRFRGSTYVVAGIYHNANPGSFTYTPDLSQPADSEEYGHDTSARLTWRIASAM